MYDFKNNRKCRPLLAMVWMPLFVLTTGCGGGSGGGDAEAPAQEGGDETPIGTEVICTEQKEYIRNALSDPSLIDTGSAADVVGEILQFDDETFANIPRCQNN